MPEPGKVSTQVHGEIQYPQIYKSLILTISHTVDPEVKIELIENLSAILEPYKKGNENYQGTVEEIHEDLEEKIKKNQGNMTNLKKQMEKKFRALIQLAYDRGFMPQEEVPEKEV